MYTKKKKILHTFKKNNNNQIFKHYLFLKVIVMNQLLSLLGIHYTKSQIIMLIILQLIIILRLYTTGNF